MAGTAVLLVTSAPGASAAVTLDQGFTTGSAPSTLAVPIKTAYLRAQTFTAGLTGPLTKVTLPWVKARGGTGNLTVEIRATSSNTPTTTVLATETIPNASLPSTLASYDVTFSSPASVSAGTTYAIVMGASADAVDVGYSNTGGYAGGRETYSTDGSTGATWTPGTVRDLYFQTYVDVVAAASAESEPPPPATYRFTFNTSTGGECFTWAVTAGPVTLPDSTVACTPEGTELVGWSVPGQSANFSDAGTVTASGDQTFTAVARNRQIRVTYDANVGDETPCRIADLDTTDRWLTVDTDRTEPLAKAAPCTPDGYVLVGWTDQPTTTGPTTAVAGAMMRAAGDPAPARWSADPNPINDIHLYAVWALATQ